MTFEWDARKAASNLEKHRVDFTEASTVFLDQLALTFPDPGHSFEERREITIGCTLKGQFVFVSHSERRGRIRIIGARRATRSERRQYEEGIGG
jgi:uncharacterized protein